MGQKRFLIVSTLLIFIIASLSSTFAQTSGTAALPSKADQASRTNIAVMTLRASSGVTEGEAEIITDRLRAELFNTGAVNIMERDQMQAILKEQGFQQSGACTDEACMVEMGKLLGVQQMYTGSIGKIGSIFMINLRIIDVQTGQVLRAVSRDINGMEVVVSNLPGISQELVGLKPITKSSSAPAPAPAPKPAPVAEPQPPATPAPATEAQPVKPVIEQAAVLGPDQEKKNNNKNRFGIRISANAFFGPTWWDMTGPGSSPLIDTTISLNEGFDTIVSRPVITPGLKLVLPLGPFLALDMGGSFALWSQHFAGSGSGNYINIQNHVINIDGGLNFVQRWFPVKLNLGFLIGYSFFGSNKKSLSNLLSTYGDFFPFGKSAHLYLGGRGGIELLAGPHVGFSFDFVYRYLYFKYSYYYNSETLDIKVKLPSLGAGIGINFYF
jgi:curli biogenesis system outer membrane secretion channel CsgG